ncbi:unnamed protein product [Orchesella dallaii]|uniref:2-(3-amino-3-carboxypropyl)histidine synthase subunit 1 n=1 Tax=Orchesella dallaii TaxID=48710 RepID=A0ABP1R1H9_9HEXA
MPPPKRIAGISPLAQIKAIDESPEVIALVQKYLPPNYDFEIGKTVWRIRKTPHCKTVALQFPEGLLIFSTRIGDVLREITGVDVILMGDITYGACCVDDFTASMLGANLLVHYGHSCLVPTSVANKIETIYVFVTINFNIPAAVSSIGTLIESKLEEKSKKKGSIEVEGTTSKYPVSLVSTIQFANSLHPIKEKLEEKHNVAITIPRSKPLSSGEILGCTAPTVQDQLIIYVGDGRFHLEAMMMANPNTPAYRYDPYNTTLTNEEFNHNELNIKRGKAVCEIRSSENSRIGVVLGTLGRQGNPIPMEGVLEKLTSKGYNAFVVLMSEVMPAKLELFNNVSGWVQFCCPRLSIDWGDAFKVPVLTPYEAVHCCDDIKTYTGHPMDYYAYESGGNHTPNHKPCNKK